MQSSELTLEDSSAAASRNWITGGQDLYDGHGGFVLAASGTTGAASTGAKYEWDKNIVFTNGNYNEESYITQSYIDLPISGHTFRVYGVWNP